MVLIPYGWRFFKFESYKLNAVSKDLLGKNKDISEGNEGAGTKLKDVFRKINTH